MKRTNSSYDPAFPFHIQLRNKQGEEPFRESVSYGLTKREYIATQMMQASLIACVLANKDSGAWIFHAQDAIDAADTLLSELEKEPSK